MNGKINAHRGTKVVVFKASAESTKVAVSLFGHTYRVYTKLNAIVKKILTSSPRAVVKNTGSDNDLRVILRVIINFIADVNKSQHDLLEFR